MWKHKPICFNISHMKYPSDYFISHFPTSVCRLHSSPFSDIFQYRLCFFFSDERLKKDGWAVRHRLNSYYNKQNKCRVDDSPVKKPAVYISPKEQGSNTQNGQQRSNGEKVVFINLLQHPVYSWDEEKRSTHLLSLP